MELFDLRIFIKKMQIKLNFKRSDFQAAYFFTTGVYNKGLYTREKHILPQKNAFPCKKIYCLLYEFLIPS